KTHLLRHFSRGFRARFSNHYQRTGYSLCDKQDARQTIITPIVLLNSTLLCRRRLGIKLAQNSKTLMFCDIEEGKPVELSGPARRASHPGNPSISDQES